jgi:hypothetical protein
MRRSVADALPWDASAEAVQAAVQSLVGAAAAVTVDRLSPDRRNLGRPGASAAASDQPAKGKGVGGWGGASAVTPVACSRGCDAQPQTLTWPPLTRALGLRAASSPPPPLGGLLRRLRVAGGAAAAVEVRGRVGPAAAPHGKPPVVPSFACSTMVWLPKCPCILHLGLFVFIFCVVSYLHAGAQGHVGGVRRERRTQHLQRQLDCDSEPRVRRRGVAGPPRPPGSDAAPPPPLRAAGAPARRRRTDLLQGAAEPTETKAPSRHMRRCKRILALHLFFLF